MTDEISLLDLAVAEQQARLAHEQFDADLEVLPQDVQALLFRQAQHIVEEAYARALGTS